jgi:hypothetical protein
MLDSVSILPQVQVQPAIKLLHWALRTISYRCLVVGEIHWQSYRVCGRFIVCYAWLGPTLCIW